MRSIDIDIVGPIAEGMINQQAIFVYLFRAQSKQFGCTTEHRTSALPSALAQHSWLGLGHDLLCLFAVYF